MLFRAVKALVETSQTASKTIKASVRAGEVWRCKVKITTAIAAKPAPIQS